MNWTSRIIGITLATGAAFASLAFGGETRADTLRWLTYKPQAANDPQSNSTQWFADQFKLRTGGKHSIDILWGGTVAKIEEIPTALTSGVGQIGDIVTPYFPDKFVVNNIVSFFMPQPFSTIELGLLMTRWKEQYKQFDEEMARYNLKVVGFRPLEEYGLICTKPIRTLEEMKGKRIRSFGYALAALIEGMGATPVSMTTPEAYEGLQRGILDCSPIGVTLARGWKYDEVAKFYIDIPFGAIWGHLIAMNRQAYMRLDEPSRAILDGIGNEYIVEYVKQTDIQTAAVKQQWKTTGVQIVPFPASELAKVLKHEKVAKVRAEWIEKASKTGLPAASLAAELELK